MENFGIVNFYNKNKGSIGKLGGKHFFMYRVY